MHSQCCWQARCYQEVPPSHPFNVALSNHFSSHIGITSIDQMHNEFLEKYQHPFHPHNSQNTSKKQKPTHLNT